MVFKNLYILVLWMKVAQELEGLRMKVSLKEHLAFELNEKHMNDLFFLSDYFYPSVNTWHFSLNPSNAEAYTFIKGKRTQNILKIF